MMMIGRSSVTTRSSSSSSSSLLLLIVAAAACSVMMTTTTRFDLGVVEGLSSSNNNKPRRPMVSLTGGGDVSGFLYGKLQRATSIYGSGLVGPATAIVHGDKDTQELLPPNVVAASTNRKEQLKDLDNLLWKQFGMATCEGSVEREDLLTKMSYLKPRLGELKDTFVVLDATTKPMRGGGKKNGVGGGGLGGLFSSILSSKKQQQPAISSPSQDEDCWLDVDLIQSAITRGSNIYIVCESKDTAYCMKTLTECLSSIGDDDNNINSIATIVSPDDGVILGGRDGDSKWSSLRPQDLEGELSEPISVRDGMIDYYVVAADNDNSDVVVDGSEARIAAATAASTTTTTGLSLSRHDLAEVCVQCALRLPTTMTFPMNNKIRVVRVTPCGGDEDSSSSSYGGDVDTESTERPNQDYFSRMGGKKAKAKAGTVTSVNWTTTLGCFVVGGGGGNNNNNNNGDGNSVVKEFPKRPDML